LNREISVCAGLRGGAGRTRTSNQTRLSAARAKPLSYSLRIRDGSVRHLPTRHFAPHKEIAVHKTVSLVHGTQRFSGCFGDSWPCLFCGAISAKTRRKNSSVTTIDCVAHLRRCLTSHQLSAPRHRVNSPSITNRYCRPCVFRIAGTSLMRGVSTSVALIAPQFKSSQQSPLTFLKHP
jgi:hypothetical protein